MSVETHVHRAHDAVEAERDEVEAKRRAFERFEARLAAIAADRHERSSDPVPLTEPRQVQALDTGEGGSHALRNAFAETLAPHCSTDGADDSIVATLRAEFSESVALALAPTTGAAVTPTLLGSLRTEAEQRKREVTALRNGLEREARELEAAITVVDDVTDWIESADEKPLSGLGFDALRERHECLSAHRDECESLLAERQAFLAGNTSVGGTAGVRHRELVAHAYREFPVDHPVLATAVSLFECCERCQRAVRDHLVRRA